MNLAKKAQINLDGMSIPMLEPEVPEVVDDFTMVYKDFSMANDEPEEVLIHLDEDDVIPEMFNFTLPMVPGGDDQSAFEPSIIEVEDQEDIEVESDPWRWSVSNFLPWLQGMLNNIPRHTGRDSSGLERAISYLEALDKEISKAVRMDLKNQIAIDAVEQAREEIHKGLERLYDRYEKVMANRYPKRKGKAKKKKADFDGEGLTKEAGTDRVNGISVTVPLLISGIVRTCINSMVSAGKDIEDCFEGLSKKYNLTNREIFESFQLFSDMGYSIRRPRGYDLDEEIDTSSTDNNDIMAQYPG